MLKAQTCIKKRKEKTSSFSKPSRLHRAYASTSSGVTNRKKKVKNKKTNAGKNNHTKANRTVTKDTAKKKSNDAIDNGVNGKKQKEGDKLAAKKLGPNDDGAEVGMESRTTKDVEKGPYSHDEQQHDLHATDTNSNATNDGKYIDQIEATKITKKTITAIESKTPHANNQELPQDNKSSASNDSNSEASPSTNSDKADSACSSEINDIDADEWPPKIPITPSSYTVKIAASDTSSDKDEEDSSTMIAMEEANNNITVELDDEIIKDDANFEKMIDEIKFSDEEDAVIPNDSPPLCITKKNKNNVDDESDDVAGNGVDDKHISRTLAKDSKQQAFGHNSATEATSVSVKSMDQTLDIDADVFTYREMVEDNDAVNDVVESTQYESVATKEARQELARKEQEILGLKARREQELNALQYVREQEMKRVEKIRRLERLLRYTDVMQVQFDARIMQLKNIIDEIQAEMLIADSVARARQHVPLEDGFEEGYENSPIETSSILSSMAERSVKSHSSFVSALTFPSSREQIYSREDSNFSGAGVTDMDMGFVSSKSSYPNMIKRLVNAYAGRPNLSGRASTESHRLLREKLKKVIDWNY